MGARPSDQVTAYAKSVVKGNVPACKYVKQACQQHLDLLKKRRSGYHFDPDKADHAISFFRFLRHYQGEWAGCVLHLEPWQAFIVGYIFGWIRADGTRMVRTAYIEIPRKNGKSTLAAGIALYLMIADGEPGAKIYSAATKKDQAKEVWTSAAKMVKQSPSLSKRVRHFKASNNLSYEATDSLFEPVGADEDTLDGLNIHGVIIDELHAHKTRAVWDVLDTAVGSRRQPLVFAITTAGFGGAPSICREQHDYAERILDGIIEDRSYFAYIATIDEGDDWADEATWAKANPNYGISVKIEDLRIKCKRAKEQVGYQNTFRRYYLNEWTSQASRWIDLTIWDKARKRIKGEDLEGRECYGGLDMADSIDIAAFSLVFPGHPFRAKGFFWVPEEAIEQRSKRDRVPYDVWAKEGWIKATEGNVIDYQAVRVDIEELAIVYDLREIAYDRWGARQLMQELENEAGLEVVSFGQGYTSMSPAAKEFMRLLVSGGLAHDGNPVLRWMADNVVVMTDPAGNIKPDKKKSREKIDGIVALIMALDRAVVRENRGSVYETRGIEVV